jgi:hypothetical protein
MSEESVPTRILVPHKKVVVHKGKLHPSSKIFLSSSLVHEAGLLVSPLLELEMDGQDSPLTLRFSEIGLAGLLCQLDFVHEVLPALQYENGEFASIILIAQALAINLRMIQFDLEWRKKGDDCHAVGSCHMFFMTKGLASRCDILSDPTESLKTAHYFSHLPGRIPAEVRPSK